MHELMDMYSSAPHAAKPAQNTCAGALVPGMLVPGCSISRQIYRCAELVITVHIPGCSPSTLKVHISSQMCTIYSHVQLQHLGHAVTLTRS